RSGLFSFPPPPRPPMPPFVAFVAALRARVDEDDSRSLEVSSRSFEVAGLSGRMDAWFQRNRERLHRFHARSRPSAAITRRDAEISGGVLAKLSELSRMCEAL